ncbi:chymotrypsin family serine protease, partial [Pseudokineococcus marinus]
RPGRWAAEVLQQRERPLRPGLSVAQRAVTAGTVGGFVARPGDPARYLLSNNHVLADSDRAAPGSAVLQPGSADGGTAADAVGRLAVAVPLQLDGPNVVDAALAVLDDDVEIDPTYPVGAVTTTSAADDGLVVEKVGRTTGLTRGAVTAIELDGVAVSYPSGVVTFDDQVEVTGADGAFSAGGDSGSLVYDPVTRTAVGLLFAGSERGGPGGAGLTFCNPVDAVLEALGVQLLAP